MTYCEKVALVLEKKERDDEDRALEFLARFTDNLNRERLREAKRYQER